MAAAAPVPEPKAQFHLPSYLLGLVTALLLLGAAFFVLRRPEPAAMQLRPPPTVPVPTPASTQNPPTPSPLVIFVSGAVQHPGLYTLPSGSRIGDAIAAAGGLLPQGDPAFVNQAQPLTDGAQLHIPAVPNGADPSAAGQGDTQLPAPQTGSPELPSVSPDAPPAGLTTALPTPTAVVRPTALKTNQTAGLPDGQAGGADAAAGLINVNTATAAELDSLPGIGPAKAQAIIDNRPYASVEELDRVPGIGPATLERLRPLVTTG